MAGSLEEYLNSPDFESQRLAYKLKKAQKNKGVSPAASRVEEQAARPASPVRKPDPSVDFFSSLDEAVNNRYSPQTQAIYNSAVHPSFSDPFSDPGMNQQAIPAAQYGFAQNFSHDPFSVGGGGSVISNGSSTASPALYAGNLPNGQHQQIAQTMNDYSTHPANPFGQQRMPSAPLQASSSNFNIDNVFGKNSPVNRASPIPGNSAFARGQDAFSSGGAFTPSNASLDPFADNSRSMASGARSAPFQMHGVAPPSATASDFGPPKSSPTSPFSTSSMPGVPINGYQGANTSPMMPMSSQQVCRSILMLG